MVGYTADEVFLQSLARRSFLRFWSWPNLFRDQGHATRGGDGKEICDLVIIFGDDILLFSDKRISFPSGKDVRVAWSRWARKAIAASAKQVHGARRWLQSYPDRVFLDEKCIERVPITLPRLDQVQFHSIVVCHGIEEELLAARREPSFGFDNSISRSRIWTPEECEPFVVGNVAEVEFVHVFNEKTVELVLKEFDTAKDFVSYLREREVILTWPQPLRIESESDIVQMYYESFDEAEQRRSIATAEELTAGQKHIDKGGIENLYQSRSFLLKKQADRVSYFWDDLIESFAFHILGGTAEHRTWQYPHEAEPALRLLAATSRFERRFLSESFLSFYDKALPGQRGTRLVLDPSDCAVGYLFFMLPYMDGRDYGEYRQVRRSMLEDYCMITKLDNPGLKCVIGLGAQTRRLDQSLTPEFFAEGQDFIVLDAAEWDDASRRHAEELKQSYIGNGLLASRARFEGKVSEFPEGGQGQRRTEPRRRAKGSERNKPCSCGSGVKAKKCCLR